jgi:hypothetical protein
MRFFRTLAFVPSLLCGINPILAQQTTTATISPVRDAQALTIITQSLTAMGAIAAPTRMTLAHGTATYPDGTTKAVKFETIGTDRVRHDIGTGEFTFVANGGDGFLVLHGKKQKLQYWATAYQRPEHLPSLCLMADYQNPNLQVQYVGLENIDGNPAHHLRLSVVPTDNSSPTLVDLMSEFHVWIDEKSMLVVKTRHFDFSPEAIQNRTPVEIFYSDYRLQDGATVPFHLVRFIAADKQFEINFSDISLMTSVSAVDFQ